MYLLFETLTLILFAFNHLPIDNNSLFIIYAIRSVGAFLNEQVKVLSSAKRVNLKNLELFGKSFMKIINNVGTPQSSKRRSEFLSLMDTYCSLLDKYDLNQLKAIPRTLYEINFLGGFNFLHNQILMKNQGKYKPQLNQYQNCCKLPVRYLIMRLR